MTNFIPLFPIEAIIYPGEIHRLHIASDNYKHLVTDCFGENKPFGIIPIRNNDELAAMGTLVEIVEVAEVWEDGRMNIVVKGTQVFKILETIHKIPDKLYGGAIVSYPDNFTQSSPALQLKVWNTLKEFHHLINFTPTYKEEIPLNSYDIAHSAGLSLQEEFELLELLFESQRLEYLRRHLNKTIPVLINIQSMLKRDAQNNDFKKYKGFDLDKNQPL
ncbi:MULTISPECIES: LON peptidase substrate-binding domain-containing protein [Chitinophagaceae]